MTNVKKLPSTRGFTLIELLVVISIIALLMSITMPSLQSARERARRLVCSTQLKNLSVAALGYASENKGWLPEGHWGENAAIRNYQAFKNTWNMQDKIAFCPSADNDWPFFGWDNRRGGYMDSSSSPAAYTTYNYWGGFGGLTPANSGVPERDLYYGWLLNKFEYTGSFSNGRYSTPRILHVAVIDKTRSPSLMPLAQDYSVPYY